jgi:hypothetical protein
MRFSRRLDIELHSQSLLNLISEKVEHSLPHKNGAAFRQAILSFREAPMASRSWKIQTLMSEQQPVSGRRANE